MARGGSQSLTRQFMTIRAVVWGENIHERINEVVAGI
ncbi:trehalose utilization protein ThuA, partial [Mesorhizobium sp. M2D.F.Ca.ET.223.01.1.1]